MTTALYLDGHAGIAGDMFAAALLDLGLDAAALRRDIDALGLPGVAFRTEKVFKRGIACTRFHVEHGEQTSQRHLPEILTILAAAPLAPATRRRAVAVFERLAIAEAQVHGTTPAEVHFHEVGAIDAIVDIVAAASLLGQLEPGVVVVSPLRTGFGYVNTAHGKMPVPAPATALLLRGLLSHAGAVAGEWTTPTGAAIAATFADRCGWQPELAVERVGWGAGAKDPEHPNALRAVVGRLVVADEPSDVREPTGPWTWQTVTELTCQIDDMSGQELAALTEELFRADALDAWTLPALMKKGRPAAVVTALAEPAHAERVLRALFAASSSLGVRVRPVRRAVLARADVQVPTPWGPVRAKRTEIDGRVRLRPEYEDCAAIARRDGLPVSDVIGWVRGHGTQATPEGALP